MALATFVVMLGLLFSKCSGFLRDIFVSMKFSDVYRDSFTLAFTIPDLFYNLLVGGAIYSTVAPYMAGCLANNEEKKGVRTVSIFVSVVSVTMIVFCVLGVVFSEPLYEIYNLNGETNPETVHLAAMASKLLFPQIFFIMFAALCIGILNAYKRFTSTAFAPTVYNICTLIAIIVFAGDSQQKLMMTTGGILVAAIIYFLFQYFVGFDKLKQFRFIFAPSDPEFLVLVRRAIPILISSSVVQINVVILNAFAGQFDDGSIYALRNASTIWQIPYGIFTVAICQVMLPSLAGAYSTKDYKKSSEILSARLRSALFMVIPSAVFIAIMNVDVVKAIYQWSKSYTDTNAERASTFLIGYCIAIVTQSVVHVMNYAFYAKGQNRFPLYVGLVGLVSNPVICELLIKAGVGPLSLTIAYSSTSIIQMCLLCIKYCRNKDLAPKHILPFLIKAAVCSIVMSAIVLALDYFIPGEGSKIRQLCIIAGKGIVAVIIYFGFAAVFRMEEATFWINRFKSKIAKKGQS